MFTFHVKEKIRIPRRADFNDGNNMSSNNVGELKNTLWRSFYIYPIFFLISVANEQSNDPWDDISIDICDKFLAQKLVRKLTATFDVKDPRILLAMTWNHS